MSIKRMKTIKEHLNKCLFYPEEIIKLISLPQQLVCKIGHASGISLLLTRHMCTIKTVNKRKQKREIPFNITYVGVNKLF